MAAAIIFNKRLIFTLLQNRTEEATEKRVHIPLDIVSSPDRSNSSYLILFHFLEQITIHPQFKTLYFFPMCSTFVFF